MTWHSQTAIEGGNMQQAHQKIPIAVLTIGTIVVRVFLSVECKDMTNQPYAAMHLRRQVPAFMCWTFSRPCQERIHHTFTTFGRILWSHSTNTGVQLSSVCTTHMHVYCPPGILRPVAAFHRQHKHFTHQQLAKRNHNRGQTKALTDKTNVHSGRPGALI